MGRTGVEQAVLGVLLALPHRRRTDGAGRPSGLEVYPELLSTPACEVLTSAQSRTTLAPDATSCPWSEDRTLAETAEMLEEVVPQVRYRVAQQGWHQVAERVAVYEISLPNAD
jgi:hypothetical protein